jgi:hypothetical protein
LDRLTSALDIFARAMNGMAAGRANNNRHSRQRQQKDSFHHNNHPL